MLTNVNNLAPLSKVVANTKVSFRTYPALTIRIHVYVCVPRFMPGRVSVCGDTEHGTSHWGL